ncbi:MAG: ABC transporter permease [Desulfobulbaceae bacterium]|nr:ABC transporter permease [Desulfobulbaceae bacterium]
MNRIYGELVKNLLLLWRDRAGLLILFLMPALLVVIITLVQNNVYKLMGESAAKVLLVDEDGGELGREIVANMKGVSLSRELEGRKLAVGEAKELVSRGGYQACIIIPAGASSTLTAAAGAEMQATLAGAPLPTPSRPEVGIFFDPTVLGVFRGGVENSLTMIVRSLEIRARIKALGEQLPPHLEKELKQGAGPFAAYISVPPLELKVGSEPLLAITGQSLSREGLAVVPTPVQHNVPAWALFGMFFIVVPMSVFFLRERQEGTLVRLLALPVPYVVILLGKVLAFILVCFCQFGLIVLIGRYLLPQLGLAAFDPGHNFGAVAVVVLAVALAATGYGLLLGCLARTYEQVSMFGSISVVVASALGGVMVPVYAMPELMRKLSVLSPVGWGLEAFLDIFVRGGNLAGVAGPVAALLTFGVGSSLVAWLAFTRRAGAS